MPDTTSTVQQPVADIKLLVLLTVFVTCMSFVNVVSAKLFEIGELTISAGIIAYWLTFPVTDVVGEVYGRKKALQFVGLGFLANILMVALTQIAVALPPSPLYTNQDELSVVLNAVPLIVFASLTAYLVAQVNDVLVFDWVKRKTAGRMLWLRNNVSTMSSQFVDSLVFNGIAFYLFADERMSLGAFFSMTVGYWLFKVGIAVIDTPLVYLLVSYFRRGAPAPAPEVQPVQSSQ